MPRHALQRLDSPSRTASLTLHILGLLSFSLSFRFLTQVKTFIDEAYDWHFQFLTIIGLALSTLTFLAALLADLTLSTRLFSVKNFLSTCSTPLEVLVSLLYWSIALIDRELVVPPEAMLPLVSDMGFHLAPAVFLTLDLVLLSPPWTIRAYGALTVSMTIAVLYWVWIEFLFSKNGM